VQVKLLTVTTSWKNIRRNIWEKLPAVVLVDGGIGNQLFICAFAHELIKRKQHVFLIYSPWNPRGNTSYEIHEYCKHKIHYLSRREKKGNYLMRFTDLLVRHILGRIVKVLKFFSTDVSNLGHQNFGSEGVSIFSGCLQKSRIVITNPEFVSEVREKLQNTRQTKNASYGALFHLRRGDYENSEYYGLLNHEYYKNAFSKISGMEFCIVSDSNDEGVALSKALNIPFVDTSGLNSWELLRLMSHQKVVVSANSTLSWWAGYIAQFEGGVHYLPTPWLKNTSDEGRWLAYGTSLDLPSFFE